MARLFHCGFETGNTLDWDNSPGIGVVDNYGVRNGSYSLRDCAGIGKVLPATYTELYLRSGIRSLSGNYVNFRFYEGATLHVDIKFQHSTPSTIVAYRGASQIATYNFTSYVAGTFRLLEAYIKIDDTVGRVVVVIDSDYAHPVIDFTGDTRNGGTGVIDTFQVACTSTYAIVDDIAINDTSGGSHNSWCGDGYAKLLAPNANGDSSALVGSDGNSVDNYLLVDEVPYNTTDYVESDVSGAKDLYNVAAPSLVAGEVINSVRAVAIAKLDAAGAGSLAVGIKTASEDWGSDVALSSTTWKACSKFYATDPADAGAWTEAKVNTLQVGVKVA